MGLFDPISTAITGVNVSQTWLDTISDNIANFRDALKIQLGLELKPSHAPISFLIVDHVERPSEN